jgi:hypothetical protein
MPQLDQFPLLFQFKAFFFAFLILYFIFLFFVLPIVHLNIKLRKYKLDFLFSIYFFFDLFRNNVLIDYLFIHKKLFLNFNFINELFFFNFEFLKFKKVFFK